MWRSRSADAGSRPEPQRLEWPARASVAAGLPTIHATAGLTSVMHLVKTALHTANNKRHESPPPAKLQRSGASQAEHRHKLSVRRNNDIGICRSSPCIASTRSAHHVQSTAPKQVPRDLRAVARPAHTIPALRKAVSTCSITGSGAPLSGLAGRVVKPSDRSEFSRKASHTEPAVRSRHTIHSRRAECSRRMLGSVMVLNVEAPPETRAGARRPKRSQRPCGGKSYADGGFGAASLRGPGRCSGGQAGAAACSHRLARSHARLRGGQAVGVCMAPPSLNCNPTWRSGCPPPWRHNGTISSPKSR